MPHHTPDQWRKKIAAKEVELLAAKRAYTAASKAVSRAATEMATLKKSLEESLCRTKTC